jgi:hypothetical protein
LILCATFVTKEKGAVSKASTRRYSYQKKAHPERSGLTIFGFRMPRFETFELSPKQLLGDL